VPRPSLLALAAVALALAGCGASKSASTPTTTTQATTTHASATKTPTTATASTGASVDAAANSKLGQTIAVDAQGDTLYVLSPETTSHLLCTSAECLTAWPPLTVSSTTGTPTAGPGVQGHLGVFKRSDGTEQVTLNGMPLYRFAGDHASGEANGEGLSSFGGTWYTVKASGGATGSTPATTTESSSEY
jgi:predicted lipoprotein with Yx(FWY)xxD motif